jgi:hypothetical protein
MNIIKLEEHFQRLRWSLSSAPSARLNLTRLLQFLARLPAQQDVQLVQSYYQELMGPFLELVNTGTLTFRSVTFLRNLIEEIQRFKLTCPTQARSETFQHVEELALHTLAQMHFYLGEWQAGLRYLVSEGTSLSTETLFPGEEDKDSLPLLERFNWLVEQVQPLDKQLGPVLENMAKEWSSLVTEPQSDRVWCVLIEQEETGRFTEVDPIGTILPLALNCTPRPRDTDQDYYLFNNRSLSLNDLLHQQVQDASTCARNVLSLTRSQKQQYYRFLYSFPEKDSFYTGDSLGLGLGLLNSALLSDLTSQPYRLRLSQRMVVTGALDMLGDVRPIGDQSLRVKLEAVFYSPFAEIVLPYKNAGEAEQHIHSLSKHHKGKKVTIHPVKTLGECLQNPSIVVKKKVPLSKRAFATPQRRLLSLAVAGVVLLAIFAGWFLMQRDTVPVKIIPQGKYVLALNASGEELWRYNVGTELFEKYSLDEKQQYKHHLVKDLDGDGRTEVVFGTAESMDKSVDGSIYYFAESGELLWRFHDHPEMTFGNEVMDNYYKTLLLTNYDFEGDGEQEIIAVFTNKPWYPCRVAVFNLHGEILEEYWHSGYIKCITVIDIDQDGVGEILFGGANNDYDQAVIGVLEYGYISGYSPEDDESYVPQGVPRGTERYYVRFPHWNRLIPMPDNARMDTHLIWDLGQEQMRVGVYSGVFSKAADMLYRFTYGFQVVEFEFADGLNREYFERYGHDVSVDFSEEYLRSYFTKLEFWDGDRWVTEPTENKYWREKNK